MTTPPSPSPAVPAAAPGAIAPPRPRRRFAVWLFVVLVAVYLLIVQGVSLALTDGRGAHDGPTSVDMLIRTVIVPVGLAGALTVSVTAWLGRWDEVFRDPRPLRRTALLVPVLLLITVAVVTHYAGLASQGTTFALTLLVAMLMVGFSEELLFRGLGVLALRERGLSEVRVGLLSSVIFGLAHASNVFVTGPDALLQAVLTTATGFVFYLVLRSTGALVAAMAAHALWNTAALSTQAAPDLPSPMAPVAAVMLGGILVTVAVLRRRIRHPAPDSEVPDSEHDR